MSLMRDLGRARYAAAQGARVAWYMSQYLLARRMSGPFNRPGEPKFEPQAPEGDTTRIRAAFLEKIKDAFAEHPDLENLLLHPYFTDATAKAQPAWRQAVVTATLMGLPVVEFSNALAYYDAYRRERLPANLLQAQRDYFGAHTYQRIDKPLDQKFHSEWLDLRRPPKN